MSDEIAFGQALDIEEEIPDKIRTADRADKMPNYEELQLKMAESGKLVDDIVLKKYLQRLSEFEVIPIDESIKDIGAIRIFKINEMVYQKDEYS